MADASFAPASAIVAYAATAGLGSVGNSALSSTGWRWFPEFRLSSPSRWPPFAHTRAELRVIRYSARRALTPIFNRDREGRAVSSPAPTEFCLAGRDSPLPNPFKGTNLISEPPKVWRTSVEVLFPRSWGDHAES
jgi:hypothetical protein